MNKNRHQRIPCRTLCILAFSMLLAGCTALPAPKPENTHIYLLDAQPTAKAAQVRRDLVLAVAMPHARPGFDTPQMAYLRQPHELEYFAVNRWADAPPHMMWPLLVQALEQTGGFRAIVQAPGAIPADVRLDVELIRLQQDFGTTPSRVQLTLRAQLSDVRSKRVLGVKQFDEVQNAASDDAYGGVIAANQVMQRVLNHLTDFCLDASASP
ncbi:MAG: membrane integrity-associated transporter subunit PqiC [Betaproteobacteria bacterium]|nr:membrane integrity-associated transporter subunit PqiC [Betaproteobacteria bacterium]